MKKEKKIILVLYLLISHLLSKKKKIYVKRKNLNNFSCIDKIMKCINEKKKTNMKLQQATSICIKTCMLCPQFSLSSICIPLSLFLYLFLLSLPQFLSLLSPFFTPFSLTIPLSLNQIQAWAYDSKNNITALRSGFDWLRIWPNHVTRSGSTKISTGWKKINHSKWHPMYLVFFYTQVRCWIQFTNQIWKNFKMYTIFF